MGRFRHLFTFTALTAAVAALAAGCGSSSSSNSAGAGASPAPGQPAARASTGAPIKIGYVNDESGPVGVPYVTYGTQAGVSYVNAHGGVNGHPIELVPCAGDGSPEKSIGCANQFVQAKVPLVLEGVDDGADAMLPILKSAGIPLAGGLPFSAGVSTSPHAYFFDSALPALSVAPMNFFHAQGVKSIVYVLADTTSNRFFDQKLLAPTAKALGIRYKTLFYSPTAPQWQVLAATAESLHPDLVGTPAALDPDCVSLFNALKSTGYSGKVFLASCEVGAQSLGARAADAYLYTFFWWPGTPQDAPAAKRAEIDAYASAMKQAGQSKWVDSNAAFGFADVVTLAHALSTMHSSTLTSSSVEAGLRATKGLNSFLGEPITCNHTAFPGQSACSTGVLMYRVDASGHLRLASRTWVKPATA
jgi:branched-chain amino acid transport system substrate-binding protein